MIADTSVADRRFCREVTRESGTSFYHALRLLPVGRREALYAIYAFCRSVDDAVDEHAPATARRLLDEWRGELDRVFRGAPVHPVGRVLAAALQAFPIPREALEDILAGCEMDLAQARYETFSDLETYCRRVASAVGLATIEVFGYSDPGTREYAVQLGLALQLTNVLRDVGEDASAGRVYLPTEDLDRFGYAPEGLRLGVYNERFREMMAFEGARARGFYAAAERALSEADRPRMAPAEAMGRTYREILDEIERRRFFVFGERVGVSKRRKLAIAASAWIRAAWEGAWTTS